MTLVYDGACAICARSAQSLARWSGTRVALCDLRRDRPERLDARLTPERCEARVQLLEDDGRLSEGFDVLVRLSARVPWLWPLWPLVRLPGAGWLGPKLYDGLSRARFRISERLAGR